MSIRAAVVFDSAQNKLPPGNWTQTQLGQGMKR
jgi:hypothetical protein